MESTDAQELIRGILQYDPAERLQISQILAHPWFTSKALEPKPPAVMASVSEDQEVTYTPDTQNVVSPTTSEATFHSASSELPESIPTTPEDSSQEQGDIAIHPNPSESTLKRDLNDVSDYGNSFST